MILVLDMNRRKGSLGFEEFVLPIAATAGEKGRTETLHYSELSPSILDRADRIILSGTPLMDREYLNHMEDFLWLRDAEVPVLGICAGLQVICRTFNTPLTESVEIGMTEIRTLKENPLFSGTFQAYELHSLAPLPGKELEAIASSEMCVQAVRHRNKEIYGILFHPEVRNGDVVRRFCEL